MASANVFNFTDTNSILETAANMPAFSGDTAGTLTVGAAAYLIATGTGATSYGARLVAPGAWKVTVNGSIVSKNAIGLYLFAGDTAVSTITVGEDGEIGGAIRGLFLGSPATVKNAGTIRGTIEVNTSGVTTITNTGTIVETNGLGGIFGAAGIEKVTNSGLIVGSVDVGNGNDTVTNTGTITRHVNLVGGINTLKNSGSIGETVSGSGSNAITNTGTIGDVGLGDGNDTLTNSGTIQTSMDMGSGKNAVTNTGTIAGGVSMGAGDDTLKNSGTIQGDVNLGGGNNTLTNSKLIQGAVFVPSGTGNNTVTNTGTIILGMALADGHDTLKNSGTIPFNVYMGGGNDTVTNTGTITGIINLSDGDDSFKGGKTAEVVEGGYGSDTVNLGAGDDTFRAFALADGLDTVDGGAGIDTYFYNLGSASLLINLDTVAHDNYYPYPGYVPNPPAANTATATWEGNTSTDKVFNFENVLGTSSNDVIYGSAAANRLEGRDGYDILAGFGGNDTLIGGSGYNDDLLGGAGRDVLWGGDEGGTGDGFQDWFIFTALSDSGTTKKTRDIIMDFETGDRIDLSWLDADSKTAGDQAFTYINGNSVTTPAAMFTKQAGQLRSYLSADGVIIEGDVNGDGKADFSLELYDPDHSLGNIAGSFVL